MRDHLSETCEISVIEDRALIALQGPDAEKVLSSLIPSMADLKFMDVVIVDYDGIELWVSRSGYTGEDGYEISVPADKASQFVSKLADNDLVEPIGLGARDSLRLEGGLCLYGNDIDLSTTPVEAALTWAIQKARRAGGAREGGFPGADTILAQFENGADRKRVGFLPEGRAPMRASTKLFASETSSDEIGEITSGGFGPSVNSPVSMGYISTKFSDEGTKVFAEVRGKRLPATIAKMPFVVANFKR